MRGVSLERRMERESGHPRESGDRFEERNRSERAQGRERSSGGSLPRAWGPGARRALGRNNFV